MNEQKLPSIWLFTGPEQGQQKEAVKQLQIELEKKQGALDIYTKYASETSISELISLLENGSLFSNAKFIVLQQSEIIKKKEDIELIKEWMKSSEKGSDLSRLVLLSSEIGVDKKLENIIPKEHKRIFWEMFESQKEQWIRSFFQKRGFSINQDGISTLLELVENNTQELGTECEKLCNSIEKGTLITEEHIDSALEHNREESPFSLFDRMTTGDIEKSIGVLGKLMQSRESNPIQIIAGLTHCFRRLLDWHKAHENSIPNDFDLKKIGFTSKKIQEQYRRAAKMWNLKQTSKSLAILAKTDNEIRTLGSDLQTTAINLLIYTLICKKGTPLQTISYIS